MGDWLPSDDILLERAKSWAKLFEKFEIEEREEAGVDINEIVRMEESKLENDKISYESIPVSEFEDNIHQDDPDFDVEAVLNQTMEIIAQRREKWHEIGIDEAMDTFYLNDYTNKVKTWLNNNEAHFTINKTSTQNLSDSSMSYINQFNKNSHNLFRNDCRNFDQDSLESVDTARYILANKKKTPAKIKTMTIKKYRYSKRIKDFKMNKGLYVNIRDFSNELPKPAILKKIMSKKKPRDNFSNGPKYIGMSSSSTSTSDIYSHSRCIKQTRDNLKFKKSRGYSLNLSKNERKFARKKGKVSNNWSNTESVSSLKSFSINSSKDLNQKTEQEKSLTSLQQKYSVNNEIEESSSHSIQPKIIYNPKDVSNVSKFKNIEGDKFQLNKEILEETIGSELANAFLNGKDEFYHVFNADSKILFYPPEEQTIEYNSEDDILEMGLPNKMGKIIEIHNCL